METRRSDVVEERVYKAAWHILIAGIGFYEFRHHRTTASKVLACGLMAFHVDGAISDILDSKPLSQRLLDCILR